MYQAAIMRFGHIAIPDDAQSGPLDRVGIESRVDLC
jgi:hypothetical protein